jgi:hypothetical protein
MPRNGQTVRMARSVQVARMPAFVPPPDGQAAPRSASAGTKSRPQPCGHGSRQWTGQRRFISQFTEIRTAGSIQAIVGLRGHRFPPDAGNGRHTPRRASITHGKPQIYYANGGTLHCWGREIPPTQIN